MKMRFVIPSAILAFALIAFGRATWDLASRKFEVLRGTSREQSNRERKTRVQVANSRPAASLPERPEDRARYPRDTFSVEYLDARGFGISTAKGLLNYDRVSDPDTLIAMHLTNTQLDSLYEEAIVDRLFEMSQPPLLRAAWAGAGDGVLTISAGSSTRSIRWAPWSLSEPWTDDHKRLTAFVKNLNRMIRTSPSYLALPPPRTLYID